MVDGTRTTYAGVAPLLANRGALETGRAEVVMAYPTSPAPDPRQQGVRLDFRWVLQLTYTSFWASGPAESAGISGPITSFALWVLDDSPLIGEVSSSFSDSEGWGHVFGDRRPEDILRHFNIGFDDFGSYDVLAVDCVVRAFTLSPREPRPWDPNASLVEQAVQQAEEEGLLLADAMALAPPPPILSYADIEG